MSKLNFGIPIERGHFIGIHSVSNYVIIVIRAALNYIRSKKNRGYRPDVISHSITQDLKMRDGLKRGMHYKLEVRVSAREYGTC